MLHISDQLDKSKKEQKELKKEKKNAEDRVKKLEKTLGKRTKSGQIPETESAYQEERDRNEVCVVDYNTTYYVKGLS